MALRLLALDTNILYRLAAEARDEEKFRQLALKKGFTLYVTNTVVEELAYKVREKEALAKKAIDNLLAWKIQPLAVSSIQLGYAEQFSLTLRTRRILKWEEVNDGQILGEAACAKIPILITSDEEHLLSIDRKALSLAFTDSDLMVVNIFSPREFNNAIGGKTK